MGLTIRLTGTGGAGWFRSSAATAQPVSVRAAMRRIVVAPVARS